MPTDRTREELAEGEAAGINAGWDEANMRNAYGHGGDAERAYAARYINRSDLFRAGFLAEHAEGVERFENDQYPDGSSVEPS